MEIWLYGRPLYIGDGHVILGSLGDCEIIIASIGLCTLGVMCLGFSWAPALEIDLKRLICACILISASSGVCKYLSFEAWFIWSWGNSIWLLVMGILDVTKSFHFSYWFQTPSRKPLGSGKFPNHILTQSIIYRTRWWNIHFQSIKCWPAYPCAGPLSIYVVVYGHRYNAISPTMGARLSHIGTVSLGM